MSMYDKRINSFILRAYPFLVNKANHFSDDARIILRNLVDKSFAMLRAAYLNFLRNLVRVVCDKGRAGLDDNSRRTVVDVEHCLRRVSEAILEFHNVIYISSGEAIDGLPIISYGKEACMVDEQ